MIGHKPTKSILFILQLPPPVHGSSKVGEYIKNSKKINLYFDCRFINLLASKNVSDSGKISLSKIIDFIVIFFKLLKELLLKKPDLCYLAITSTGPAFFRDVILISLLKIFKVMRIYHMHNKGVSEVQDKLLYKFIYEFVFKDATIILLSEYLYPDIDKYVDRERVFICPNGIPDVIVHKVSKNEPNKKVRILFLSNLIESKGVKVLLEACKKLKEKNLVFECVYIGGEGDISANKIKEEIELMGLEDYVIYLGKRYGEEKEQEFSKADIFAFPTFYEKECLPLVLLEAQQHSLPIISTFEGGIKDIVESGKNGYLVPQRDIDALTEKLELFINTQELRIQMGISARSNYEEKFTLKKFENRILEILDKTLTAI